MLSEAPEDSSMMTVITITNVQTVEKDESAATPGGVASRMFDTIILTNQLVPLLYPYRIF